MVMELCQTSFSTFIGATLHISRHIIYSSTPIGILGIDDLLSYQSRIKEFWVMRITKMMKKRADNKDVYQPDYSTHVISSHVLTQSHLLRNLTLWFMVEDLFNSFVAICMHVLMTTFYNGIDQIKTQLELIYTLVSLIHQDQIMLLKALGS